MSGKLRNASGSMESGGPAASYTDVTGAYMDYDGSAYAQFGAKHGSGGSIGTKIRTILSGVVKDAITIAASGLLITLLGGSTLAAQAITGTTLGLSGAASLQAVTATQYGFAAAGTWSSAAATIQRSTTLGLIIQGSAGSSYEFVLQTANGAASGLLMNSAGNITMNAVTATQLGLGIAPLYQLDLSQSNAGGGISVRIADTDGVAGTNTAVQFKRNGSAVGSIATTLTTTAYNTSSDQRLKDDIGIATSLDVLRELRIHDFYWKVDRTKDRGVFAQEAFAVKPSAVRVGSTVDDPWAVDYSKFVPDLVVGWQSHDVRLSAIEARLGL